MSAVSLEKTPDPTLLTPREIEPNLSLVQKTQALFEPAITTLEMQTQELVRLQADPTIDAETFTNRCMEHLVFMPTYFDGLQPFEEAFEEILSLPQEQAKEILSNLLVDLARKNQFQLYNYLSGRICRAASDEILSISGQFNWDDLHVEMPLESTAIELGVQAYWSKKMTKHADPAKCIINDPLAFQNELRTSEHQQIAYISYYSENPHTIPIFFERSGETVRAIITDSIIDLKEEGEGEVLHYLSMQEIAIDTIKKELIPPQLGLNVIIYRLSSIPEQSDLYSQMENDLARQNDAYNCSIFAINDLYQLFKLSSEDKLWDALCCAPVKIAEERVVVAFPEPLARSWQSLQKLQNNSSSFPKTKDIGVKVEGKLEPYDYRVHYTAKEINVYIQRLRYKLQAFILAASQS